MNYEQQKKNWEEIFKKSKLPQHLTKEYFSQMIEAWATFLETAERKRHKEKIKALCESYFNNTFPETVAQLKIALVFKSLQYADTVASEKKQHIEIDYNLPKDYLTIMRKNRRPWSGEYHQVSDILASKQASKYYLELYNKQKNKLAFIDGTLNRSSAKNVRVADVLFLTFLAVVILSGMALLALGIAMGPASLAVVPALVTAGAATAGLGGMTAIGLYAVTGAAVGGTFVLMAAIGGVIWGLTKLVKKLTNTQNVLEDNSPQETRIPERRRRLNITTPAKEVPSRAFFDSVPKAAAKGAPEVELSKTESKTNSLNSYSKIT